MKKEKIYNTMLIIAIIVDLCIFGWLIYENNQLKKKYNGLEGKVIYLEEQIQNKINKIYELETKIDTINNEREAEKKAEEIQKEPFNVAVDNLDKTVFLTDIENYNPENNEIKISENKSKQIAQKGFTESKSRIAGEGADDIKSETVKIDIVSPNNYFTRYNYERDERYTNIQRKCYIITRINDMGNGISIYVDVTTGLIIGGEAFGD